MKRTPLRTQSKKRRALMTQRSKFVQQLLDERDHRCEARLPKLCTGWAVDVHEKLRRSQGGLIVGGEPDDYMILCRSCHTWITEHPQEAKEMGFARSRWDE